MKGLWNYYEETALSRNASDEWTHQIEYLKVIWRYPDNFFTHVPDLYASLFMIFLGHS
jgi:hypothetical protein